MCTFTSATTFLTNENRTIRSIAKAIIDTKLEFSWIYYTSNCEFSIIFKGKYILISFVALDPSFNEVVIWIYNHKYTPQKLFC